MTDKPTEEEDFEWLMKAAVEAAEGDCIDVTDWTDEELLEFLRERRVMPNAADGELR